MKKKRREKQSELTYCLEVTNYDPSYMFSLATRPDVDPGPYWEHAEIEMKAIIIYPKNLEGKSLDVTILGDRDTVGAVANPETCNWQPKSVGRLTLRGKTAEYLGSVPFDALIFISQLLKAGDTKFLILRGERPYRGSATIRSMRFEKEFGPEDWS